MTEWWKRSVVYQVYPRSFKDSDGDGVGDLRGIVEKLDYLEDLGIDVVWLSPVYKSPNEDMGYDISDYQDIMDEFGTLADWEELAAGLHERGIHRQLPGGRSGGHGAVHPAALRSARLPLRPRRARSTCRESGRCSPGSRALTLLTA